MASRLVRWQHPFYGGTPSEARYGLTGDKIYKKIKGQWVKDPAAAARAVQQAQEIVSPWFQGE